MIEEGAAEVSGEVALAALAMMVAMAAATKMMMVVAQTARPVVAEAVEATNLAGGGREGGRKVMAKGDALEGGSGGRGGNGGD